MKIYNEDKTKVLEQSEINYALGRLVQDTITHHIDAVEGQEEISHYETIAEYPNGGKDVELVIDQPKVEAVEEHDEVEEIQVYIPYTEDELTVINARTEIVKLKNELSLTDYKAIKYAEGWITEDEYASVKTERQTIREKINNLENTIESLSSVVNL